MVSRLVTRALTGSYSPVNNLGEVLPSCIPQDHLQIPCAPELHPRARISPDDSLKARVQPHHHFPVHSRSLPSVACIPLALHCRATLPANSAIPAAPDAYDSMAHRRTTQPSNSPSTLNPHDCRPLLLTCSTPHLSRPLRGRPPSCRSCPSCLKHRGTLDGIHRIDTIRDRTITVPQFAAHIHPRPSTDEPRPSRERPASVFPAQIGCLHVGVIRAHSPPIRQGIQLVQSMCLPTS